VSQTIKGNTISKDYFGEKQLTSNTGSSKKKVTSNRCYPNSKIGNGPPMGWGGVTADDDRGCYDPIDPPV